MIVIIKMITMCERRKVLYGFGLSQDNVFSLDRQP